MSIKDRMVRHLLKERVSTAGWLRWLTGFDSIVAAPDLIPQVLTRAQVTVPYLQASAALGLGGFPLALDGSAHVAARGQVGEVLAASAGAHQAGVARAVALAGRSMAASRQRLDVVDEVVDPVLATWVEAWFGLPGLGDELLGASRLTMHTIFFNPKKLNDEPDLGDRAIAAALVADTRERIVDALADAPDGTVARELQSVFPDDPQATSSFVLGLTVGPLALGSRTIVKAIDRLLTSEGTVRPLTSDAHAVRVFNEMVAQNPPLEGLPRCLSEDVEIEGHCLAAGGSLLALTEAAAITTPDDPAAWSFGAGPHECMGRAEITQLATAILMALSSRRPRRMDGPQGKVRNGTAPAGIRAWDFPGHLMVVLTS